jgi:ABC-type transport system involved in multi-copper enzyme maturation permease subunit
MHNLAAVIWVETRKALRSRMPIWTTLGSLFMPLGIAFLIFISKNPAIFQKLGLIGAKANLVAYSATDWTSYLRLYGQIIAAGGFFLFILIISWVFGREFTDGTVKDILAVPVPRSSILAAKFIVVAIWCGALTIVIFITGLITGALIGLPGASSSVFFQESVRLLVAACLVIAVILPFAFFASLGRGYLLPIGMAVLTLMTANLVMVIGWAEYFPWAVVALYAQGNSPLPLLSYINLFLTSLAGILVTYLWWKYADQNR